MLQSLRLRFLRGCGHAIRKTIQNHRATSSISESQTWSSSFIYITGTKSWKGRRSSISDVSPNQYYSTNESFQDQFSNRKPTVESEIIALMDMWKMEEAVALFRISVMTGILPNTGVVLNLLQQLGNLGDYECLLSLRELLMDNKLCSNEKFFGCLQKAYFKSERVDEAVLLLRMLYHDVRNYADVDIFFTLVGVMLLEHFPKQFSLVESFAKDCRDKKPMDLLPTAGLWKCLILTKHFKHADILVNENTEVRKYIPLMINDIVSEKNKVDIDRIGVLSQLKEITDLSHKLQKIIYFALINVLVTEMKWDDLHTTLCEISDKSIPLISARLEEVIVKVENILFNEELDNFKLMQIVEQPKLLRACHKEK